MAMREHVVEENRLLFHSSCGSHAAVINGSVTAHRPNANDDFNFGVVLTNRPLKPNEVFEVRLDRMVTKWAGSIEIGVTTHAPGDLDFPSTMTNIRSGTWMMTGNGRLISIGDVKSDPYCFTKWRMGPFLDHGFLFGSWHMDFPSKYKD